MYDCDFVIKLRSESEALSFLKEMEENYKASWRSGKKLTDTVWTEYFHDCDINEFGVGADYHNGKFSLWYDDWDNMMESEHVHDNYKIILFHQRTVYKF